MLNHFCWSLNPELSYQFILWGLWRSGKLAPNNVNVVPGFQLSTFLVHHWKVTSNFNLTNDMNCLHLHCLCGPGFVPSFPQHHSPTPSMLHWLLQERFLHRCGTSISLHFATNFHPALKFQHLSPLFLIFPRRQNICWYPLQIHSHNCLDYNSSQPVSYTDTIPFSFYISTTSVHKMRLSFPGHLKYSLVFRKWSFTPLWLTKSIPISPLHLHPSLRRVGVDFQHYSPQTGQG